MSQIPESFYASLTPMIEEYNSAQKILKILLVAADLDLVPMSDPYQFIVEEINKLYEQATIELVEQSLGLAEVEAGASFESFGGGGSVQIQEDYLLEEVHPFGYIPASVVDYTDWGFLKYRKIRLIYKYEPDFDIEDYEDCPDGQRKQSISPAYGYPPGMVSSWEFPDLSESNPLSWVYIFSGYGAYSPEAHWRYRIFPEWVYLLSAHPGEEDETYKAYMLEDVIDCFRQAVPSDGSPWWSENNPYMWISKGINDDWVDSYVELKTRDFAPNGYMRPWRWMQFSDIPYEYFHHPTQPEDHIRVQMRNHEIPSLPYKGEIASGAGTNIPYMSAAVVATLAGKAVSFKVIWPFSPFSVDGEPFSVNGELFNVRD